jgi:hypothetical protein
MTVPENSTPVIPTPAYRQDSPLAVASLICGLVGWIVPFFGSLAAVITGHMAKKDIRESNGQLGGDGMALAGLIMGYIQLSFILLCVLCIMAFVFAVSAGSGAFDGQYTYLLPLLF